MTPLSVRGVISVSTRPSYVMERKTVGMDQMRNNHVVMYLSNIMITTITQLL